MSYRRLLNVTQSKLKHERRKEEQNVKTVAELIAAIHNFAGFGSRDPKRGKDFLGRTEDSNNEESGRTTEISPDEVGDLVDELDGNK